MRRPDWGLAVMLATLLLGGAGAAGGTGNARPASTSAAGAST
jgi:hypothetical protein